MNLTIDHVTTNEELGTAVLREIEWRPDIHSQDISVKATGPTVTLTGFVHTFAEKANAERAAKSVRGVISIANDIEVRPSTRTDPEIARDVQHVLKSNVMVPEGKVTATLHEGFVTLEGFVEWNFQKAAAVDAAESVRGVRGVINLIIVKTRVSPASVKEAIEAALRRSAEVDAQSIQVVAHDSTVELTGKVHSFSERDEAERAAWAAPGIESVVNRIRVVYRD
jgi:osmotically-inducible protein OsmY